MSWLGQQAAVRVDGGYVNNRTFLVTPFLILGVALATVAGRAQPPQESPATQNTTQGPNAGRESSLPIPPSNPPQTEADRKAFELGDKSPAAVVNAFNQMAFFDRDPVGAMKKYLADDFIERYPDFAIDTGLTDKEAVIQFFQTRGWKKG